MSADPYPIRTLVPDDWPAVVDVDTSAFGFDDDPAINEENLKLVEWGRWIGAFDEAELVGVSAIHSFTMGIPGGAQPVAGVTWVGVRPTHRRRGILRSLMTQQLHALHEQGAEPWAALWASEPVIYGRFGYGLASQRMTLTVPRSPRALRAEAPADPSLRLRMHPLDDWKAVAPVYEAMTATRPGMAHRTELWHEHAIADLPGMRTGRTPMRCVVAEDADGIRGYVRYAVANQWDDGGAASTIHVKELVATDPAAHASLLRFVCDLDLSKEAEFWNVPVDDPVWFWLTDVRRARPRVSDGLYVRLVDVDRALAQRSYAADVDVVFDVTDELCPWNAGRWRLRADAGGATCERTDDPADVALPVTSLGSVYLGGPTLLELERAGLVSEQTEGAVAAVSAAFAHDPAPWSAFIF